MRIGFFGDIHGQIHQFYRVLLKVVEEYQISTAIQVGDFGISKSIIREINDSFKFPIPVYFIDGNHEDFRFLWKIQKKGLIKEWEKYNLHYQPRGSTLVLEDNNFGFLGGALHIGRPQKIIRGNVITTEEFNKALYEFSRTPPEILITHSCPAGIGIGMHGLEMHYWGVVNHIIAAGFNPGPMDDCGEIQLTNLWNQMLHHPTLWVYGHFHEQRITKIDDTLFVSLPHIDYSDEYIIWDTQKKELLLEKG